VPPVQVSGEVLAVRREGVYHALTLMAPEVAEPARPGQFVALAVGGPDSAMLLRRAFSIRGVSHGTVEVVFAVTGRGTGWLAERRPRDLLDVVGPLGRPFALPRDPVRALLVGGGYGAAPLFWLGAALRDRGCRLDVALGGATAERLFGTLEAKRMSRLFAVTTDDGSAGQRGRVTEALPGLIERAGTEVVYACGPMPMLAAVARLGAAHGLPVQVAVEEVMACGIGVCMTCVLPVVGADGVTRMLRSCVEGPVFRGDRVRFDDVGTVPADAFGAPAPAVPAVPAAADPVPAAPAPAAVP
jgi:dihydroorotate dehydrogenase electron transfer subunit